MRNPWGFSGAHVRARIMRTRTHAQRERSRVYMRARESAHARVLKIWQGTARFDLTPL